MSETETKKTDVTKRANNATDVQQFIADLDGGVFEQKIGIALSDVAAGAVDFNNVGEVTVKFKIKRIDNSAAVVVAHSITQKRPTSHGDRSETDNTSTPMYIGAGGKMTIYPMGADTKDMFSK